jgi:hypothetical protein
MVPVFDAKRGRKAVCELAPRLLLGRGELRRTGAPRREAQEVLVVSAVRQGLGVTVEQALQLGGCRAVSVGTLDFGAEA